MKKVLFPIILIGCTLITNAQVGVGTDTPQATLQINGKLSSDSKDGIIIPRITKTQLSNKLLSTYEVSRGTTEPNQFETLVFITEFASYVAGSQPSAIQVSDINSIGYYYFSDSGKWTKIDTNTNLYNTNGTLSSNRVVNMDSKSLIFSGRSTSANNDVLVFGEINENDKNPAMIIKSSRRIAFQLRDPRVSFDIYTGLAANIDSPEGILIPKMNATDLARKNLNVYQGRITNTNIYSGISGTTAQGSQEGTLVYVYPDEIDGEVRHPETGSNPSISKITEVTSEGLYYYGVDDKWHPVGKGVGDSSKDAWVDNPTNTRVHLGATSTGAVRPTGTEVIVTDAGRVGIGTANTTIDAGLHLVGDNDGYKDDLRMDSYSSTSSPAPNFRMYSSRGTQALPVNLSSSDNIGQINFHGRHGNTFANSLTRIGSTYRGDGTTALSDLNISVSGASNPSIYISPAQNVGISTNNPTNKLEISNTGGTNTGLKLPQGSGLGLKLTSDESGNAYWNNQNVIVGNVPATGVNLPTFTTQTYTGANIVLTKGKWVVDFGTYIGLATYNSFTGAFTTTSGTTNAINSVISTDSSIWCTCSLSSTELSYTSLNVENNGLINGSGKAGANNMSRGSRSMQVQGKILLNVTDAAKTYYMFVLCDNVGASVGTFRPSNVFGNGWERWFYATPI